MTKKLLSNKFIWVFLAFMLLLFPVALDKAPQTRDRAVVIGIGLDKNGDEYLFSTKILEPTLNQGFAQNVQVYSATGENCLQAMQKLTTDLGKISGLSNTSVVVVCEDIAKEGVGTIFDFLIRSDRLNDNPIFIVTKKSAKQLLLDISKIDSSFSLSLNSLSKYNGVEVNSQLATMEQLLNNYYGGKTATLVAQINEREKSDDGIAVENQLSNESGGDSGQDSESQSGSSQKEGSDTASKTIENAGDTSLFVGDKQVASLSSQQVRGFGACLTATKGAYTLKNVSDENLKNADVVLTVKAKCSFVTYNFSKSGNPRVTYHLRYEVQIENIIQKNLNPNIIASTKSYLTKTMTNKFKEQIASDVSKSLQIAREYNADVFGAQDGFEKFKPKKWAEYLKNLQDKTDAFKNIDFFLDVQVKTMT